MTRWGTVNISEWNIKPSARHVTDQFGDKQCRRSGINLGDSRPEATSLTPSILPSSLPCRGLPRGLGRARSPAAKHFGAIYAVKQPYKIHM